MRSILTDVIAAARQHACPIVHISRLAGEAPFVASTPCLGHDPIALIDLSVDDYLAFMAELRNVLVVELDETLSFPIFTGGARDPKATSGRLELPPRTTSGRLDLPWAIAAVYYMMDSVGQETTIVYDGLGSFADIQHYWKQRGDMRREFIECYQPGDDDVRDLAYRLDRTVALDAFDLGAFAAQRGLVTLTERAAR